MSAAAPGLFGVVSRRDRQDLGEVLARMLSRGHDRFRTETLVDGNHRWAIGRTHLGTLQPLPQLDRSDQIHVVFHGDLYNERELERDLGAAVPQGAARATSLIRQLYTRDGSSCIARLDGTFGLTILDTNRRQLIVATDAGGSYPLYWAETSDGLVFGSSVAAILRHGDLPRRLDPAAVADYVTFGLPLGVKTLAQGVRLIPAATILTHDWNSGTTTLGPYARIADLFQPWPGGRAEYIEALVAAWGEAVARSLSGGQTLGLSLSGGLDSRAILSAVNGQASTLETYTLGVKGCADEVIADRLARIVGTRHTFFELDDRYLKAFLPNLERLVEITDGMYLSHGLTEMLALGFLSSARFAVLLRGHGGELAKTDLAWPLHTDARIEAFTGSAEFVPYMLARANYISRDLDLTTIFVDGWHDAVRQVPRASLEESVAGTGLGPSDLCSYLYLNEHHRRVTTASLEVFRQVVEVRLPFVDPVFLRVLFRGPAAWRRDTGIHRALTKAGNAALLRVRNSNTGAPADAGPIAEAVADKFNTLFKRLNVAGFRHYHNFQAWMSRQLLSSVDEVLLSRTCLDRGMLRGEGIRRLLDDTRAERADHSYLLQTLLILELWQRQNL